MLTNQQSQYTSLMSNLLHMVSIQLWTPLKEWCTSQDFHSDTQAYDQSDNNCTIVWSDAYFCVLNIFVLRLMPKLAILHTISYNGELNECSMNSAKGKVRLHPLRFNCIKIFLDTSFIQDQSMDLVAKKQDFPKRSLVATNLWDRVRSRVYKEDSKEGAYMCP